MISIQASVTLTYKSSKVYFLLSRLLILVVIFTITNGNFSVFFNNPISFDHHGGVFCPKGSIVKA